MLILIIQNATIINQRLGNLTDIDNLQFRGDSPIHSRLDSWEVSWEMIKENPLFGSGLGGFRGYNNIEWTNEIKYPHNLFLEITAECGFIGLFILVGLLLIIFRNVYRFSFSDLQSSSQISATPSFSPLTSHLFTLTFFLFTLWLAMFSKDISSQSMLWIGLAFAGFKRQ
jgi:O-antigen ligase